MGESNFAVLDNVEGYLSPFVRRNASSPAFEIFDYRYGCIAVEQIDEKVYIKSYDAMR